MRRCALAAVALVGLTIAMSACDSDETPGPGPTPTSEAAAEPASDAVRTGVVALYTADDASEDQLVEAGCFADELLERLDLAELRDAGIVQDDGQVVPVLPVLDVPTAEEWVAAQGECADFVTVSTRAVVVQSKGKADAKVYETCLRGALSPEQLDAAIVDTLTGHFDSAEVQALSGAQAECSRSAQPSD